MKGLKITALILTAAIGATALTACKNEKKPVSSGINIISSQKQGGAGVDGENIAIIDPEAEKNNFIFKWAISLRAFPLITTIRSHQAAQDRALQRHLPITTVLSLFRQTLLVKRTLSL